MVNYNRLSRIRMKNGKAELIEVSALSGRVLKIIMCADNRHDLEQMIIGYNRKMKELEGGVNE